MKRFFLSVTVAVCVTPVHAADKPFLEFLPSQAQSGLHQRCEVQPTQLDRVMLDTRVKAATPASSIFGNSFESNTANIVFHLLEGAEGAGAVSDEQLAAQLLVLNDAFSPSGFQFEIARTIRYPASEFFQLCYPTIEEGIAMKRQLAIRPAEFINVYSCELLFPFIAGYATFPNAYAEDDPLHGVNVDYRTLPGGSWTPYNLGATLVHEMGHYLGLFHTFQGGCTSPGDEVGDTPAESSAAAGCPIGRDTCPGPGVDPVTNYMNYSDDACMQGFSSGQARRMGDLTETFRPRLFAQ